MCDLNVTLTGLRITWETSLWMICNHLEGWFQRNWSEKHPLWMCETYCMPWRPGLNERGRKSTSMSCLCFLVFRKGGNPTQMFFPPWTLPDMPSLLWEDYTLFNYESINPSSFTLFFILYSVTAMRKVTNTVSFLSMTCPICEDLKPQ